MIEFSHRKNVHARSKQRFYQSVCWWSISAQIVKILEDGGYLIESSKLLIVASTDWVFLCRSSKFVKVLKMEGAKKDKKQKDLNIQNFLIFIVKFHEVFVHAMFLLIKFLRK